MDRGADPASATTSRTYSFGPLIVLGTVIGGLILAGAAMLMTALYDQSYADHRREIRNLAVTLAEQANHALLNLAQAQRGIIEQITASGATTPQAFDAFASSRDMHQMLRERISDLPDVDAIAIIDSTGELLNFTRVWPTPRLNVADRDYFIALKNMSGPAAFVSAPSVNRVTGVVTLYLARRITAPDGSFLGLVLGTMQQNVIERNFAGIDLGASGLIALARNDGTLLARVPGSAAVPDESARQEAIARAVSDPGRAMRTIPAGVLDGLAREAAVQPLAGFPLAVIVSKGEAWLEKAAWKAALPIVVAALLVCALIGIIVFFVIRQVQGERAFFEQEHRRARHDALTGLPNRLFFSEHLETLLAREKRQPLALLFLDVDYFKTVNDTLGHAIGDALLQAVAKRLFATVPSHDVVARLGGDEFAVVCRQGDGDTPIRAIAQVIIDAMRAPFLLDHHQVLSGCSVGIAKSPRDGTDVATLLKCADLALYAAKNDGRGTARLFQPYMDASVQARRAIELDLYAAWENQQFRVAYQPIFEAESGRLAGFEALLRWHHPVRGEVPPEDFVPIIEESGLILKVGNWVLDVACRTAAGWPEHLFVSVNISPVQFRGGRVERQVEAALAQSGLDPTRLELEITESLLLKADAPLRQLLDRLRARGVALALDDFGTGYSSLKYLHMLNISRLKIDQSFIRHIVDDVPTRTIVKAVISLAKSLGLKTTAEGIETEAQLDFLRDEGCTHLQGYRLGAPMAEAEARQLAKISVR